MCCSACIANAGFSARLPETQTQRLSCGMADALPSLSGRRRGIGELEHSENCAQGLLPDPDAHR